MKQEKNKSYAQKEAALFAKVKSRRLQRWYNNRLSKIDSQERIWLIVFTRPSKNKNDWNLKFWVWDSQEDRILGENILFGYIVPKYFGAENVSKENKYILNYKVSECYIERNAEFVVFRYSNTRALLLFNFKGELVIQTDQFNKRATGDETMFSKFVNKNLIFSKAGDILELFYLDEITGIMPKNSAAFLVWYSTVHPKDGDIQVIIDNNYCVLYGYDKIEKHEQGQNTIWLYTLMSYDGNSKGFQFKMKFTLDKDLANLEAKETDKELIISFQEYIAGKLLEEKVEIKIPKTVYK